MKLTVKGSEKKVEQYKPKNLTKVQEELFKENLQAVIPYGKHANKLLAEVIKEDPKYVQWIRDKELMHDWGLMVLKDAAMTPEVGTTKPRLMVSSKGEIWVGLRIVEEKTTASIWV